MEIVPFFKEIEFFKEKEIKDSYYIDIVQAFTYERIPENQCVF